MAAAWKLLLLSALLAATARAEYSLIREGASCAVDDKYLGSHCTPSECAAACAAEAGCWFFSLGRGELHQCRCWAKFTEDAQCSVDGAAKGLSGDQHYDFYSVDISNKTAEPFIFYRAELRFNAAEAHCVAQGGHLASIRTPEELTVATDLCKPHDCWIGFTDRAAEGSWTWIDGAPADFAAFPGGVAPWGPHQPDNRGFSGVDSDGAYMWTRTNQYVTAGTWDDSPGQMSAGFLCRTGVSPP
jgi:hypothetical protein